MAKISDKLWTTDEAIIVSLTFSRWYNDKIPPRTNRYAPKMVAEQVISIEGLIARRHNEVKHLIGELCLKSWGCGKEPIISEDEPCFRDDLAVRGTWKAQKARYSCR